MEIPPLIGSAISVQEALESSGIDGDIVCVHGVLYSGPEFSDGMPVLFKKGGFFDGVGLTESDPPVCTRAIALSDADLPEKLQSVVEIWSGAFAFKYDCVVIGRIRRIEGSHYGAHLIDLQILMFQSWRELSKRQKFYFLFPGERAG